jgi:hypothetical protein
MADFPAHKAAVDEARRAVAALINCDPDEVFFTSCGTESDNCGWPGGWGEEGGRRTHRTHRTQGRLCNGLGVQALQGRGCRLRTHRTHRTLVRHAGAGTLTSPPEATRTHTHTHAVPAFRGDRRHGHGGAQASPARRAAAARRHVCGRAPGRARVREAAGAVWARDVHDGRRRRARHGGHSSARGSGHARHGG